MARRPSAWRAGLTAAALGLLTAVGASGSVSAGEPHRASAKPTAQVNHAPVRQRAVSTAIGLGGDAFAAASNQSLAEPANAKFGGGPGAARQISHSPTVQTAIGVAVSVGGNSAALASNNGPAAGPAAPALGLGKSVSPLELGRAPRTSTAVSTAVSIDGVPIPTAR